MTRSIAAATLALLTYGAQAAPTVLVVGTDNSGGSTTDIAAWLMASSQFSSVTALDTISVSFATMSAYDEVLFFTNHGGDPVGNGDALASFASTGRRLVVSTFSYAEQGGNTLGGAFISGGYSPFTSIGSSLYTSASMGSNDASALFTGVSTLSNYYRDNVVAAAGATLNASYDDGVALVATKGNVIGINVFPDDSFAGVSGDHRQLFVNALSVPAVPEPESYAMLLAGLGLVGVAVRRRRQPAEPLAV
ncbi:PEPxxWA-CTERM sorting domain-containing protein [Rugamonas sp. CCM 8940]|uniref:PEPxxWA-CTERM sorting domain-containing protein n=1 Tax=Rugamonas sp. CCM 8940 TaxID=2765359 RepID=UPI001F294C97|nr:PEPxxWA-CTERM sorting domain-containing protein [Rugamonas sp. CCM 8940]